MVKQSPKEGLVLLFGGALATTTVAASDSSGQTPLPPPALVPMLLAPEDDASQANFTSGKISGSDSTRSSYTFSVSNPLPQVLCGPAGQISTSSRGDVRLGRPRDYAFSHPARGRRQAQAERHILYDAPGIYSVGYVVESFGCFNATFRESALLKVDEDSCYWGYTASSRTATAAPTSAPTERPSDSSKLVTWGLGKVASVLLLLGSSFCLEAM